ncbi:MAG TPA: hypothetical protein VHT24_02015 [Pseudacidobacterium sp.]|jgi:uncharacterized membrane protein YphA (DoxX/SURF4 family)|nr:hypothetical protein [Pseudacidobacterium sp.]
MAIAYVSSTTKRATSVLLWLALIAQIVWMASKHFHLHVSWATMWYPLTFVVVCLLLACTNGRIRGIATVLRILIALAFLQAVSDRFGVLGAPGTAGVAWGDFAHFIVYTGKVNSFMPPIVIPALAVTATSAEIVFGLTLLLGIYLRYAAVGSALLLAAFATAMTISGLSQFKYSVYLMAAGALYLASVDVSFLSIDAFVRRPGK